MTCFNKQVGQALDETTTLTNPALFTLQGDVNVNITLNGVVVGRLSSINRTFESTYPGDYKIYIAAGACKRATVCVNELISSALPTPSQTPQIQSYLYCDPDTGTTWVRVVAFTYDSDTEEFTESLVSETDLLSPCASPLVFEQNYCKP